MSRPAFPAPRAAPDGPEGSSSVVAAAFVGAALAAVSDVAKAVGRLSGVKNRVLAAFRSYEGPTETVSVH